VPSTPSRQESKTSRQEFEKTKKKNLKTKMPICLKVHKTQEREVISLCDQDLIGKKFEQDELQLDIKKGFYKGKIFSYQELLKIMEKARNINAVGKESVSFLLKNNLIKISQIRKIQGVPIANIFML